MARNDIRRSQSPRGGKPDKPAPTGLRRFIRRLFVWGGSLALLGVLALAVAVGLTAQSLPSFEQIKATQNEQMIVVRARDGTQLVSLGPSYGKWVGHREIPQVMKDAMLSVEDRRFYNHPGIDPIGLARSFWVRFQEGRFTQGGSTITQQLARTVFLNNSKTLARKLREAVLALALEWKFSKDQILELYLNKVYFGGGAY
ncbi:MAG: transglycosylase domain-containing protein, partial [Sphingomonadaceae bacterium]|nr:transglycosylase domain-containing protein [Sphingomonadaceae bacterium]